MTRFLLLTPFVLAACATPPCPIPVSCIEPDWCVCVITGAVDPVSDDGGAAPQFSAPDDNGGPTQDDHGPGNGGATKDDHNGGWSGDSKSSDWNGGKS